MTTFPKPQKRKKRSGRKPLPPRSAKGQSYVEELDEITPAVLARAGHFCEAKLDGCTSIPTPTPHHRKRRSQGGTNALANLMAVCWSCHRRIHEQVAESLERGYLLRRGDPEAPLTARPK